jgi:hypothetical protein
VQSQINYERYVELLKAVASMSRLYSDNTVPYVDSRFVERLFIESTGATDLSRLDKSFDALLRPNIGVGVKTFLAAMGQSKREKVAEFTRFARDGEFVGLPPQELAKKVAGFRNQRVMSDANELGISLDSSIYHCLVRTAKGAVIHEEPYSTIDIANIRPTDTHGKVIKKWSTTKPGAYFTDGNSNYKFSISKNVLYKEFRLNSRAQVIELDIFDDIFDRVLKWFNATKGAGFRVSDNTGKSLATFDEQQLGKPGVDYVVLPLYSTRGKEKQVAAGSGINQWNAGGRARKFGETYIPIPSEIHKLCPKFFPERDKSFKLTLPNGAFNVPAKVCQDGRKALMSDPNTTLGHWIMKVIRPTLQDADFLRPTTRKDKPFTYADLISIGKDSVVVKKITENTGVSYSLEFAPLDSYEDFIAEF